MSDSAVTLGRARQPRIREVGEIVQAIQWARGRESDVEWGGVTFLIGAGATASDRLPDALEVEHEARELRVAGDLLCVAQHLDAPNGITTLFSVAKTRTGFAALARVTLWTEWGGATGAFDLLLLPGDVQTMNVRDLLNTGSAPTTSGQELFHFPDCIEPVGGTFENPIVLRRAHTGVEITSGLCASAPRADTTMATGYITVDLVTRCSDPAVYTTPATPGYLSGPNRLVSDDNVLWGDFFLVDPGDNLAQGRTAVPPGGPAGERGRLPRAAVCLRLH